MRKILCSLALSGALAVAGNAAFAQSDNSAQQPATPAANTQPMQGHRGMDPDKQVAELSKKLSLSADQQRQIKPILVDRQQQMQAIHQDQSMSQSDRMAKMQGLRADSNTKIEAILNDAQKQKFDKMQAKQQERIQQRQQGGAAPANSPS